MVVRDDEDAHYWCLGVAAIRPQRPPLYEEALRLATAAVSPTRVIIIAHGAAPPPVVLPPPPAMSPTPLPPARRPPRVRTVAQRANSCHSLLLWNARALTTPRVTSLLALDVPIVGITETWKPSAEALSLLSSKYEVLLALRADAQGGGVLLGVQRGAFTVKQLLAETKGGAEIVVADVKPLDESPALRIGVIYVPPNLPGLRDLLADLWDAWAPDMIVGDYNAIHDAWSALDDADVAREGRGRSNASGAAVFRFMLESDVAVVAPPSATCSTGSVIDLALCRPSLRAAARTLPSALGSDHRPVVVTVDVLPRRPRSGPWRVHWRKVEAKHWEAFSRALETSRYAKAYEGPLADRAAELSRLLRVAARATLPYTRSYRGATRLPRELERLAKNAADAWSTGDSAAIALAEAQYRDELERHYASSHLERAAAAEHDPRVLWSFLDDDVPESCHQLEGHSSVRGEAQAFAQRFAAVHAGAVPTSPVEVPPDPIPPISQLEMEAALARQRKDGAADPSGLCPQFLRHLPTAFVSAMRCVANASLATGEVPQTWRDAIFVPVPKDVPAKPQVERFRPVALTDLLCRLVERVVLGRLESVAVGLETHQYGFTRHMRVDMPLAHLFHEVEEGWREKRRMTREPNRPWRQGTTLVLAVDKSDAFARVTARDVVAALLHLGAQPYLVKWIANFMEGRRGRVRWRGRVTEPFGLDRGAPMGSILGPFLWLLVADTLSPRLVEVVRRAALLDTRMGFGWVADDLTVWVTGWSTATMRGVAEDALGVIAAWAEKKDIGLSAKSRAIILGGGFDVLRHWAEPLRAKRAAFTLPVTTEPLRLLGVWLDNALSMSAHCQIIERRVGPLVPRLRQIARWLRPHQLQQLYVGKGLAQILHGSAVWAPKAQRQVEYPRILDALHGAAARAICGTGRTAHSASCLAEANLPPLSQLFAREAFALAVRILHRAPTRPVAKSLGRTKPASRQEQLTVGPLDEHSFSAAWRRVAARPVSRLPPAGELIPSWRDAGKSLAFILPDDKTTRSQTSLEKLREHNEQLVARHQGSVLLLADGSVREKGAAGAMRALAPDLAELAADSVPAGKIACSATAELRAIVLALQTASRLALAPGVHILCCTDSRANIEVLQRGHQGATDLLVVEAWRQILHLTETHPLTLAFVFAHCGWGIGDVVDAAAEAAAGAFDDAAQKSVSCREGDEANLWERTAASEGETQVRADLAGHLRGDLSAQTKALYLPFVRNLTPGDARLLHQLRTGVVGKLGGWRYGAPDDCPHCSAVGALARGGVAVRHLFVCPATAHLRATHAVGGVTDLVSRPATAVAYAKDWLAQRPGTQAASQDG